MIKTYVEIGKRLREIRENSGTFNTKHDVADFFNITVEYYDSIERGRYLPNLEMIYTMNKYHQDIDYVLTGKNSGKSVFEEIFVQLNNNEKSQIGKLLLYKMKLLNSGNAGDCIIETKIRSYSDVDISPYDRVKDIIEQENNYKKMSISELAIQLGVSERTINRLNKGESLLNTEIILNIYYKYGYYPSYVLFGEMNSNSKIDQIYELSDKSTKDTLINCARELAAYCKAGKKYESCHM